MITSPALSSPSMFLVVDGGFAEIAIYRYYCAAASVTSGHRQSSFFLKTQTSQVWIFRWCGNYLDLNSYHITAFQLDISPRAYAFPLTKAGYQFACCWIHPRVSLVKYLYNTNELSKYDLCYAFTTTYELPLGVCKVKVFVPRRFYDSAVGVVGKWIGPFFLLVRFGIHQPSLIELIPILRLIDHNLTPNFIPSPLLHLAMYTLTVRFADSLDSVWFI